MDRGAWYATVHWVAKSQSRLSDWTTYSNQSISSITLEVQNFKNSCFSDVTFLFLVFAFLCFNNLLHGFSGGSEGKESTCNVGHLGSIPGLGRSPLGGHGNPLQYSCLENFHFRGSWWATVLGLQRIGLDWATTKLCQNF